MKEICPRCGKKATKVSYHNSLDSKTYKFRQRKTYYHRKGAHTIEIPHLTSKQIQKKDPKSKMIAPRHIQNIDLLDLTEGGPRHAE